MLLNNQLGLTDFVPFSQDQYVTFFYATIILKTCQNNNDIEFLDCKLLHLLNWDIIYRQTMHQISGTDIWGRKSGPSSTPYRLEGVRIPPIIVKKAKNREVLRCRRRRGKFFRIFWEFGPQTDIAENSSMAKIFLKSNYIEVTIRFSKSYKYNVHFLLISFINPQLKS